MFAALHTPVKKTNPNTTEQDSRKTPPKIEKAGPSRQECNQAQPPSVRDITEGWELVKKRRSTSLQPKTPSPPKKTTAAPPAKSTKPRAATQPSQDRKSPKQPIEKFPSRSAELLACCDKITNNLELSKTLRTDLKKNITIALNRMLQLLKEPGTECTCEKSATQHRAVGNGNAEHQNQNDGNDFKQQILEHSKLLRESNERMVSLKEAIEKQKEILEKTTYAGVAAGTPRNRPLEQTALHSVVVSSKDENVTGDEVLRKIREAVKAKEGGIQVDRIRKARDSKVILGCRTEGERQKVKERIQRSEKHLNVEDIANKDPLLILRDVLKVHSDEDVTNALRNQNGSIFKSLDKKDDRVEIRYRRKARNPHQSHIVLKVSPKVWNLMIEAGEVHIDLQRVKVADQSPIIQCSLCLGYGHTRRYCKESTEKCSHCGGPHMKANCADWLSSVPPTCCNCTHAKLDSVEHNAFSQDCAIRRKWDALARASVAYC